MSNLNLCQPINEPILDDVQRTIKRCFDLFIAVLSLIFFAPVAIILSILIKLEDGGPVLYRSKRIGQYGKPFTMLKFRSMVMGGATYQSSCQQMEGQPVTVYKVLDDSRVTKIGRWMRATSLDELPQLIHVLRGEMSLVGPRPELPWLLSYYESQHYQRFGVPQGMTGWWQINGRRHNPMQYQLIEQDIYYIEHYSFGLDLLILWRTIGVVFRGEGM